MALPREHADVTGRQDGSDEQRALLDYWYSEPVARRWFASTPALDEEMRARFEALWRRAASGELDGWAETPEGTLALVIVLDQLPLNMFLAAVPQPFPANRALWRWPGGLSPGASTRGWQRTGCCSSTCPSCTARTRQTQNLSVALFRDAGMDSHWAEHHRDIVRRFGRFPHRNAILGRRSTAEELAYLASDAAFTG